MKSAFLKLAIAWIGGVGAVSAVCVSTSEGANTRFVGRLANGERVAGDQLTGWDRRGGELKLGDISLQGEQPFHWLKDQDRVPPDPKRRPPHVEMRQGDILPGVVVGYEEAESLPATPGHFVIACSAALQPPPTANELPVRVKSDWVRRIVFSSDPGEPLEASQLRLRDGKVLPFRAIRMEPTGVVTLGESGRSRLRWAELGEIRFPDPSDSWAAHWRQLAVLTPEGDGRLLELQTEDHLAVTTSMDRLAFPESSKGPDVDAWVHGVHPVWALDAIWVPSRWVWLRVAYAPHELPLSRLHPADFIHQPTLGVKRSWQRDRSVLGDSLLATEGPAGWGIGVHSYSKISFELAPAARRLKGTVALDITAGSRGCVKAKISANGRPCFASNYLLGAQSADFDVELAKGSHGDAPVSLSLEVESADENRPANADPLDVRDQTNWLDVLVLFDEQVVCEHCRALASDMIPAWQEWTFSGDGETQWISEWDGLAASPGAFVNRLKSADAVTLARTIRRRPAQRYLVLSVSNADSKQPAILEVHSGGEVLLRRNVPERSPRRPSAPLIVASLESLPLDEPRDLVVVIHSDEPVSLHWQALAIVGTHPEYTQLFDDQEHPQAINDRDVAYAGPRAYRISPGKPLRHTFREPMPFRYRPDIGESRYVRFAVSTPGKALLALRIKLAGETQPLIYDLGQGPLTEGRARRIFTSALSSNWLAVSRDVCGDVRDADVEWIEFFVPEGMGEVYLDQAYVGRGGGGAWNDLETPLVAPWHDEEQRRLRVMDLAPRIGAGIVGLQFEDGRTAEGFVLRSKQIVTLGEAAPLSGPVRITAADGKQFEGKLLGVSRTHNWALIESTSTDELPTPSPRLDGAAPIPFNMVMVECGTGGREATAIIPGPLPSNRIRSLAPTTITPTMMGRPVLAASGHVVGLRADREQARYVSLMNLAAALNDLSKPERRGKWLLGEGPQWGFKLRWSETGAVVGDVSVAARAAGIQAGDVLLQVEGRDVRDSWSAHRAVCERDPGQDVTLQVQRGSEAPREIKLRLAFR